MFGYLNSLDAKKGHSAKKLEPKLLKVQYMECFKKSSSSSIWYSSLFLFMHCCFLGPNKTFYIRANLETKKYQDVISGREKKTFSSQILDLCTDDFSREISWPKSKKEAPHSYTQKKFFSVPFSYWVFFVPTSPHYFVYIFWYNSP